MPNLDSMLKSRDITLPTKVCLVRAMVFPLVIYGCESWTIKKAEHWRLTWCFQTVVLEKILQSPLDSKEIKLVNPKGNQPWIFIGRTNAEAKAPILWPPEMKSRLLGKDPNAGKDWRCEEKVMTEDEMVGWHQWLNGHEFSKLWEMVKDRGAWHAAIHGVAKSQTWLCYWTTTMLWILSLRPVSS